MHLDEAFHREVRDLEGNLVHLRWLNLGELTITSGKVMVCDPVIYSPGDTATVSFIFTPGRYPVYAIAAPVMGVERVALAFVCLSDHNIVHWQEWTKAQRYVVESGIACFMDSDAATVLFANVQVDKDYPKHHFARERHQSPNWLWSNMVLDPATGANLVAVHSGLGDDIYATRLGYDANGHTVCLLTEFRLIDVPGITEPEPDSESF